MKIKKLTAFIFLFIMAPIVSYADTINSPSPSIVDQAMWSNYSSNIYLCAESNYPTNGLSPHQVIPLNQTPVNQSVTIDVVDTNQKLDPSDIHFTIDQPTATITNAYAQPYPISLPGLSNGNTMGVQATFQASQPGVYTIQAQTPDGNSIPFVLTVGLTQLMKANTSPSVVPFTGIAPFYLNPIQGSAISSTNQGMTFSIYPATNGWLPVSGNGLSGEKYVTIWMANQSQGQTTVTNYWTYRLPVIHGTFSASIRVPYTGNVVVEMYPHYFQSLNQAVHNKEPYLNDSSLMLTTNVSAPVPSAQELALMASAQRDYNLSPLLTNVANTFYQNTYSIDSTIQAISNYVSDHYTYNSGEMLKNSEGEIPFYQFVDVANQYQQNSGVCEDYATLAVSMLNSVGIPAQTIIGSTNNDSSPTAHEWARAYDGTNWLVFDPTWDSYNDQQSLSNEYFTSTPILSETHFSTHRSDSAQ